MIEDWLEIEEIDRGRGKCLYIVAERPGVRDDICDRLVESVRSHYDDLANIEADIAKLGFPAAAAILRKRLPSNLRSRSGELGEILATEFMEDQTDFRIPIRRLRYKDGRNKPIGGDDFIGIKQMGARLSYLKGEAKSGQSMGGGVIATARDQLKAGNGRPTSLSLVFVADRLLERDGADKALGRLIRKAVALGTIRPRDVTHGLFTLTGNDQQAELQAGLDDAPADHDHVSVNLRIIDHPDFIAWIYDEVENLGDN